MKPGPSLISTGITFVYLDIMFGHIINGLYGLFVFLVVKVVFELCKYRVTVD